jgi:hypothetical protein
MCENQINLEPDELACYFGKPFVASVGPAVLDRDIPALIPALIPAEFTQSLHKSACPLALCRSRTRAQQSNGRHLHSLLGLGVRRPSEGTGQRGQQEAAAVHYSMT